MSRRLQLAVRIGAALALAALVLLTAPEETRTGMLSYRDDVEFLVWQHLRLVGLSMAAAIGIGVPLALLLTRKQFRGAAEGVIQILNIGATIPTLAVLGLAMTILGIGDFPAMVGLWLVSVLPIVRNTYVGVLSVQPAIIEAARGMGMNDVQILFRVEIPNALLVIFTGIRIALTLNVGTAPLAFLIGGGGLGELIFTGLALNIQPMMLAGAMSVAALAIMLDMLVAAVQRLAIPRGIAPHT